MKILPLSAALLALFALNYESHAALTSAWEVPTMGMARGPVALADDGTIYLPNDSGLQAFRADSTNLWEFSFPFGAGSAPMIGPDGTIYVGGVDKKLHAISPAGTERWAFTAGDWIGSTPALVGSDAICFGSNDGRLYLLNLNGTLRNSYTADGPIYSSPAVGPDGAIYFGSADTKIRALNSDGSFKWQYITGNEISSSPAIGPDGTIYVASNDGKLYALSPGGAFKWAFETGTFADRQSPVVVEDGTIYFPGRNGVLFAVNPNGSEKWRYTAANSSWSSSVTVLADGAIIGTVGSRFYIINSNGTLRDSFVAAPMAGAPAVASDGSIFYGVDRWLLKFIGPQPMATGGWPTFHRDLRRTGAIPRVPAVSLLMPADGATFVAGQNMPMRAEPLNLDEPGVHVSFYANGALLGTIGAAPYRLVWTNILNGDYALIAVASSGSQSATSGPVAVKVLPHTTNLPPSISFLLPTNNATFFHNQPLSLQATAQDHNGLVTHVSFYDGATLLATADYPDFAVTLQNPAPKVYALRAVATDNFGASQTSSVVRVTILNQKSTYTAQESVGSPSAGPDGAVYFGSDRALVALNADGSQRWRFNPDLPATSIPTIGADGTVYVAFYDNNLYAIDSTGSKKWEFPAGGAIRSCAAVAADGTIYFGSSDWKLYALNPSGSKKWDYTSEFEISTAPAIGSDGTIYFTSSSRLYALSSAGAFKWSYPVNGVAVTSPAVGSDGTVYFGALGRELHAVSPQGAKVWAYTVPVPFNASSPIIGKDGTIYCGAGSVMHAVHPNGTRKWEFAAGSEIMSAPILSAAGDLYFSCFEYRFVAIDSTGQLNWSLATPARLTGTPVLTADGVLSFNAGNSLVGIQTAAGPDSGPWPMFHQNPERRGQAFSVPQISSFQPAARTNYVTGETIHLSVAATSPNGPIVRAEFYSGLNLIASVTNPPFSFAWTNAPSGVHQVHVKVLDVIGANVISEPVRVDVVAPATVPQILLHPFSQTSSNGASVTLIADAFGSAPLAYQWFKDGSAIPNAAGPSLTLNSLTLADSATYHLKVSNLSGDAVTQGAVLSVLQPYTIKWTAEILDARGSPAIAHGTRVIIPDHNGITARGPGGQFLWLTRTTANVWSSPAISGDGNIYFGANNGELSSMTADGDLNWIIPKAGGQSSPVLGTNGVIYSVCGTNLFCLRADGTTNWIYSFPYPSSHCPVIGKDGTIYFGTDAQYIPAKTNFSAFFIAVTPEGIEKWRREFTNAVSPSSAIAEEGSIIFGCRDKRIYSFSPDGSTNWQFAAEGPVFGAPVIAEDGTIYIGGEAPQKGPTIPGRLYALTSSGHLKWKFSTAGAPRHAPAVAQDGTIYFGAADGGFYALNANGTLKWIVDNYSEVASSPVIAYDGTVFYSSLGLIHAVEGASPLARSAWPMWQHDVRHTGNASTAIEADTFFYPFSSNAFDDLVTVIKRNGQEIYVGGFFTIGGGVPANRIAKWDGQQWLALGEGLNAEVLSIAIDGTNVYAGGAFTRAGGVDANYVARWDGTQWHPLAAGVNDRVYDLEVRDGALIAAGGFTSSGNTALNAVAAWNGSRWTSVGSGLNGVIFDLLSDGRTLYASAFGALGTIDQEISSVIKWDGSQWLGVGRIFGDSRALAMFKGSLYVGGAYLQSGRTNLGSLARWNGVAWTSIADVDFAGIATLASTADSLYVGGPFQVIANTNINRIARYDGANWFPVGKGVSGSLPRYACSVNAIDILGTEIFIGGAFTSAGGKRNIYNFAHWNGQDWNSYGPLLRFIDGQFQLTLSDALGLSYSIEASEDLVNWRTVATFTDQASATQFIDENAGMTPQRFYRAVTP